MKIQNAFTLAEVLITLGIIGIIAAMTLPTVVSNYKKRVVETRLQRFYSVANNALLASQSENESWDFWYFESSISPEGTEQWYDTYLAKYWKTTKVEVLAGGCLAAYFPDGSLVIIKGGRDYFYYPDAKKYSKSKFDLRKNMGLDMFPFAFYPERQNSQNYKKGIQPYIANKTTVDSEGNIVDVGGNTSERHTYTLEELYNDPRRGCHKAENSTTVGAYCTQVIYQSGWKIPDEYPFKF